MISDPYAGVHNLGLDEETPCTNTTKLLRSTHHSQVQSVRRVQSEDGVWQTDIAKADLPESSNLCVLLTAHPQKSGALGCCSKRGPNCLIPMKDLV